MTDLLPGMYSQVTPHNFHQFSSKYVMRVNYWADNKCSVVSYPLQYVTSGNAVLHLLLTAMDMVQIWLHSMCSASFWDQTTRSVHFNVVQYTSISTTLKVVFIDVYMYTRVAPLVPSS